MPLARPEDHGSEADESRSRDYCAHCYRDGAFTLQEITMGEMRELCVDRMVERKVMPRAQANRMLRRLMPTLKRWAASPQLPRA